jgi:hypothetical protein
LEKTVKVGDEIVKHDSCTEQQIVGGFYHARRLVCVPHGLCADVVRIRAGFRRDEDSQALFHPYQGACRNHVQEKWPIPAGWAEQAQQVPA